MPHLSTAQDARAVRTREALRQALLELLEVMPLDQITIRDISARAGVGYTTFFRHHPTKESLIKDLVADQIQHIVGLALPLLDSGDTRATSLALFRYVNEHRELWFRLLNGGAAGVLHEEFLQVARQVAAQRFRPDHWFPAEVAVVLVIGSTIELLTWWLRQAEPLPLERIAEIHDRLIVSPIQAGAWQTSPSR